MSGGGGARERRRARRAAQRKSTISLERTFSVDEVREALAFDPLTAGASGSTSLPLSDRDAPWDAAAADKSLDPAQFGDAHFWRDPDKPADQIGAYKLGFASAEGGTLTAVWKGVTAAAGALQGARGGVNIPSGDVGGVRAKIAAYYTKAAKKYGDDSIKPPWEASAETEATPERAALAAVLAFAKGTACANCGHAFADHAADGGACSMAGCDCMGFVQPAAAAETAEFAKAACANCDHAFSDHLGSAGPCTYEDNGTQCSCKGFAEAATEAIGFRLDEERLLTWARGRAAEGQNGSPLRLVDFALADAPMPAEHQPGADIPTPQPGPQVTEPAQPIRGAQLAWTATLVVEGVLTDDGRAFAPGSITWRELPLTLMGMIETSEAGHTGAVVSGRIDQIWKDGLAVKATGVFDEGEFGAEVARMVGEGTLCGVSVDVVPRATQVGPVSDFFDPDGNWRTEPPPPEEGVDEGQRLLDILFGQGEEMVWVVTDGVIGAATVCPFPAFADASIELEASLVASGNPALWTATGQAGFVVVSRPREGDPGEAIEVPPDGTVETVGEPLTASAEGIAPVAPPAEWFQPPNLTELTALTVDEEGRVSGHAWAWDSCHTGFADVCVTAPHSQVDYAYFHLGEVECEDGSRVACGKITLDTGHADRSLGRQATVAHYDDTGTVVAHICCGEDEHGGWVAGALHSECDADKARLLRGAVLSGDWRRVNGNLELVALLAVNVPGFPVPRTRALVAASDAGTEVMALTAAGVHAGVTDADRLAKVTMLGLRASGKFEALAARARAALEG